MNRLLSPPVAVAKMVNARGLVSLLGLDDKPFLPGSNPGSNDSFLVLDN